MSLSALFVAVSIAAMALWGFKLGIDFTGGSLLEVYFPHGAPSVTQAEEALKDLKLDSLTTQPTENSGMIFRFQQTSEEVHQNVLQRLNKLAPAKDSKPGVEELSFESVGPSVGQELQRKAIWSIILVLIAISLYIAWAFRKVSRPVASWKYGMAVLIALFHDVVIVLGFYSILGHFLGVEINTSFVAAALTVLGFSVHDSIVVFDRIRENLPRSNQDFAGTVNVSLNQTLTRSINTSLTVMLVLASITILGGRSIEYFALALLVGIFFGTYSSIFLASPLLVVWEKWARRNA